MHFLIRWRFDQGYATLCADSGKGIPTHPGNPLHDIIYSSPLNPWIAGFGVEIQTMESSWLPRFLVSAEGKRFLEHPEEIAS
jgi:hypothetical protein